MTVYKNIRNSAAILALLSAGLVTSSAQADIVQNDDVIITFSLCVGNDCVNGENFGFDTIRLKENNVRLHFDDTSTSASFPRNDWRIIANDSSNGGDNYLAIEDSTAGRQTFRVDAGAPSNSLRVDSAGDVGIGVANPVVDLHVVSGNTPTLRLEQNGSSGFTAQTYDVASNEANFFIRDVTNGSALFFRAQPGAPANSLYIASDGDIGLGTTNPSAALDVGGDLHVKGTDIASLSSAGLIVEEESSTEAARIMAQLKNKGVTILQMTETSSGSDFSWNLQARNSSENNEFRIVNGSGAGEEFVLTKDGDLTITGTLTEMSDRDSKTAIVPVDSFDVLEKVANLPISAWTYKHDYEDGTRHIGPMAQDFYSLFGTGVSDKGISSLDTSGVALAAIQALHAENTELHERLTALENSLSK